MELNVRSLNSDNYSELVLEHSDELPDIKTLRMYEEKSTKDTLLKCKGVVTSKGKLVGFGSYVAGTWDPILKPGYAEISIEVNDAWRKQGIGNLLLNEIEEIANENDDKALQTSVADTNKLELEWIKSKGFEIEGHTFESQLDLSLMKFSDYDDLFNKLASSNIHFTNLEEYRNEDGYQNRFWDYWWELVIDVPGMEEKPRPDNERMIELTRAMDKKGFIIAVDGDRWIGMSMIIKEKDEVYYNSMTGVSKGYRGQGLAQALKMQALEYALQNGATYVRTHNDSNNAPMLAINEKLGYLQKPGTYSLIKHL